MADEMIVRKELRQFGLLIGGIFTVIGLWPPVLRGEPIRWWAVGVGGGLMLLGAVVPHLLAPLHAAWMWVGHVLGWINTRILLGLVFYGILVPIAIIFRFIGRDTMKEALSQSSPTYRATRSRRPSSHMKYQF